MSTLLLLGDYSGRNVGHNAHLLSTLAELRLLGPREILVPTLQPKMLAPLLTGLDGVTLIDDVRFGAQQVDIPTGRMFDGGLPWVTLLGPTPNRSNDLVGGCGQRGYAALDPTIHRMSLGLAGTLKINSTVRLQMAGGPRSGSALLFLAVKPDNLTLLPGFTVLLKPPLAGPWAMATKADGSFDIAVPIPNDSGLVSRRFYVQLAGLDAFGLSLSNPLELAACK